VLRTGWNDHDVARATDPLFAAEAELHLALEHPSGGPTHPDPSSPTPRLEPLGRNRVKSGDRREKWNAFGTLLSSRIRLVSSHFASCKRFASSRSCPTIAVRRRWTALARSGYLIRDLANPCQPTAYLCPKAEDGNRRKSVLQRARQRSG
jgi:hypothetical protein